MGGSISSKKEFRQDGLCQVCGKGPVPICKCVLCYAPVHGAEPCSEPKEYLSEDGFVCLHCSLFACSFHTDPKEFACVMVAKRENAKANKAEQIALKEAKVVCVSECVCVCVCVCVLELGWNVSPCSCRRPPRMMKGPIES
jgi:hypothetical protein